MNLLLKSAFLVLLPLVAIAETEQIFIAGIRDLMIGSRAPYTEIELYRRNETNRNEDDKWIYVASNVTDAEGVLPSLVTTAQFPVGVYKLIYRTGKYYESRNVSTFYPYLAIVFKKSTPDPILVVTSLSPYGYFFYKGAYAPH